MIRVFVQPYEVKLQPMLDDNGYLIMAAQLKPLGGPLIMRPGETHPVNFVAATFTDFVAGCFWETETGEGTLFTAHDGKVTIHGDFRIGGDEEPSSPPIGEVVTLDEEVEELVGEVTP